LINHITKIFLLILFCQPILFSQTEKEGNNQNSDTTFVMHKSPLGAVLMSAVIPGLGQIYNESYWKAPIIWGIGAWFIYNWDYNNDRYKFYKNLYLSNLNPRVRDIRTNFRDQRDLFTIYMALLYILNLVDAYVDAHLYDFTVEENFSTNQPMFGIRINF